MAVEFDPAKSRRNVELERRGFDAVERFKWSTSIVGVSKDQKNDTATRFFAVGEIDDTIQALIFTIGERGIRIVSLRPASPKERKSWRARQRSGTTTFRS